MKTKLLQFHNFIQREFYPDSRQYFEQRFYSAFDLISFNNNQVVHWDNKKEFEFFSIQKQYPFIDDLIPYRKKINTLEEYCDMSYYIITDYFNRLKKDNILYTNDFFESKQEVFANNIVKDKRGDFFISLKTIFSMIEEKNSMELKEQIPRILPLIKNQKLVIDLLKNQNILDKDCRWIPDKKNHKKKFITVLVYKLRTLKLIEYTNYKIFHKEFEKLINCQFDYSKSTGIITCFEEKIADKNSRLFFDSLSFLDILIVK